MKMRLMKDWNENLILAWDVLISKPSYGITWYMCTCSHKMETIESRGRSGSKGEKKEEEKENK